MAVTNYLIDTSATSRVGLNQAIADRVGGLLDAGLAYTCAILDLEALYSARSPTDYRQIQNFRGAFIYVDTDEKQFNTALETQSELAAQSMHRSRSLPDLIIAAVAAHYNLTVLHYDHDYDIIAKVTGQPTEWVVPRPAGDSQT